MPSSYKLKSDSGSQTRRLVIGITVIALIIIIVVFTSIYGKEECKETVTESTTGKVKCGELIFQDVFDDFNLNVWEHENTMSGDGNWEFQIYQNNRSNSYTKSGILYIKPTLTSDKYGEPFLTSGRIDIGGGAPSDQCTNTLWNGCTRQGTPTHPVNPILSARIRTQNSFAFKYGKVEIKAKLPSGDYLWPGIRLIPQKNYYGSWPASGQIDLMESRGNVELINHEGVNIGSEQITSTLHFGPYPQLDAWEKVQFKKNSLKGKGYDKDFHLFQLEWTPQQIKFSIDNAELGVVKPPEGFWKFGEFPRNIDNPWQWNQNTSKMTPFDQKFYLVINLAVGGVNGYFPDNAQSPRRKPWKNTSPNAFLDFWRARKEWEPTWEGENSAFQIDYIKVWAL